ncbi:hypothetical protein VCUG_02608 [Vavraia culicis subsp. floridensis]|uniref:Uncharacterized protein n=1 Tax=Vavraia culicis (isolate floridensis) TaxID=948595 RepID=L2GRB9_VAVCU|nr:uncharacterized protein VCUG_02608 [Vavraia culicis subsp. floridensis]ELA45902.1 hypothetical protein VCUG_02608 [Vavraia culicis subsp. floridensis]
MFLFVSMVLSQCNREGMYRLPILTYLDTDTVQAIAFESDMIPAISAYTKASNFLGQVFNEVNAILIGYGVQLQLSLQSTINLAQFLDCGHPSPINTFMKSIDERKRFRTRYNKLFIIYCDNFYNYLDLNRGVYNGNSECTTTSGIMYVNNVILREKIKDVLLGMVARTKVKRIGTNFERNLCQYVNECVDGQVDPVGDFSNWLRFVNNVNYDDGVYHDVLKYDVTAQQP